MIEINLLPGSGKKKASRSGGGAKLDLAATFAGLSEKVRDKYLAAAVASVVIAAAAFGWMYTSQSALAASLDERAERAEKDSSVYAAIASDGKRLTAKRDTLLRQMNVIRSIDDDRYVWPHILDEVSKALPPYTWLSNITYTGAAQGSINTPDVNAKPGTTPAKKDSSSSKTKGSGLVTTVPQDSVRISIMGETVDIQALTRFMRQLEASPFLSDVQLQNSQLAIADGKEVTQFTIYVSYSRPDSTVIRRVPLALTR